MLSLLQHPFLVDPPLPLSCGPGGSVILVYLPLYTTCHTGGYVHQLGFPLTACYWKKNYNALSEDLVSLPCKSSLVQAAGTDVEALKYQ